ncbi:nt5c2 [Scenedesmus sp. PABB004]|nr:nt5c2 [Scenedesmus sp. PABB004]
MRLLAAQQRRSAAGGAPPPRGAVRPPHTVLAASAGKGLARGARGARGSRAVVWCSSPGAGSSNGSSNGGSSAPASSSSSAGSFSSLASGGSSSTATSEQPKLYGDIPAPPSSRLALWTEQPWGAALPAGRQIFCNRSLNMKQIKAVGFDMDYTLAQYKPDTFEQLAHSQTVDKLVSVFGYPPSLYDLTFDWRHMMRGLIIDKKRGNVIKVDRHKYVKVAYHGFTLLTREQRNAAYNQAAVRDDFEEPAYAMIDTLFSLAEGYLFMQLVEMADATPRQLPNFTDYAQVYRDVRAAVDLCHRDGSLKRDVAAQPAKYIHDDPHLVGMLGMMRASGRKVFLATNSLWDYTHVVMNYLVSKRVGRAKNDDWLRLFDVVIVGCGKPGFFSERRPLFGVNTADGTLVNTDGGAPIIPIGEEDLPPDGRQFGGGNYRDLHTMLGVDAGSQVLYVGDHIYGDILRSKKSLGWRTMLVVPELEAELAVAGATRDTQINLSQLRGARGDVDAQIQRLLWAFRHGEVPPGALSDNQRTLEALRGERERLKELHSDLLRRHHEAFHPVWGRLLKTGYQHSRYATQIDRFACLYTSHVANLAFVSPDRAYQGRTDVMAHEDGLGLPLGGGDGDGGLGGC